MADKKITQLDELAGVDLDDADDFVVRDTSTSVTKKIKKSGLLTGLFKNLLTTDGDILTRSGGVPARITRANLFADPAATSRYLPWQANTAYTAGTFVSHAGHLYTVDADFTSPSSWAATGLTEFSGGGGGDLTEYIGIPVGDELTTVTTGTAKVTFRMPFAMTI